ncbi:cytochrome c [Planctomicrobium sp. SH661]|uniref:cytochrome c n=1 Tax=Planctomicrobium sp. SH661 TaxID=3448124 RepID=UPI003F5CB182
MRTFFPILALLTFLSGCGKLEFSHRAEYYTLEPYAQDYVSTVLKTHFGTPTEMVVWDRLPVKSNLSTGTVTSSNPRQLVLELSEPHQEITPGTEILWNSGPLKGQPSAWIYSWDEKTHTATLQSEMKTQPEPGTQVIVGPGQVLVRGRHLYAVHCQHCHGVSGDGNGPTAEYLNPLPRDYRKGIFKFTSTLASERASRADLARTIADGIPGTYMPSFKLLTPDESESIVEYILWLSMRGETEYQLVRFLAEDYSKESVAERVKAGLEKKKAGEEGFETTASIRQEFIDGVNDPEEIPAELASMVELMTSRWIAAQEPSAIITPQENRVAYDARSIAHGRELYLSKDLNCVACHGDAGYGDGPQTYSITKDLETGKENAEPGLYDAWGQPIAPRNLHTGIYRGGRRPIDLYDRVHAGIKGTPMPAFGAKLKDQDIWDIVNFIYSVPFETEEAGAGMKKAEEQPAAAEEVATN